MIPLSEMAKSSDALHDGLQSNAARHLFFNLYTSMERAMSLLLTGEIYITNGSRWNDVPDRELMKQYGTYGMCLSCSTMENIAMWMLYSGNRGKNGAMVSIPRAVMEDIQKIPKLEVVEKSDKDGKFHPFAELKENGDFEISLMDMIYTENLPNGKVRLTWWNQYETVDDELLKNAEVFYKNYAWQYERECRLVVNLSQKWERFMQEHKNALLRITIPPKSRNALKDHIVRSPVYEGDVDFGKPSSLFHKVDWNL